MSWIKAEIRKWRVGAVKDSISDSVMARHIVNEISAAMKGLNRHENEMEIHMNHLSTA